MLDYYKVAKTASLKIGDHPGLLYLKQLCASAEKVLDVGCGEGTRLAVLLPTSKSACGVDINTRAINQAKKQYPMRTFYVANANTLPFLDNEFDLVYSAFTFEHVNQPEQIVSEMLRVTKSCGKIVILTPNFGAPNRRSPNSIESPIAKLLFGFIKDFTGFSSLEWKTVTAKPQYNNIDDDTTIEPYLYSLEKYLKSLGLKIIKSTSLWEIEAPTLNPRKVIFKILGKIKLFPFNYWGPQAFICAQKS